MGKFAKVFDVDDAQVLVQVIENDEELPSLKIKTIMNEITFETAFVYSAGDKGWKDADNSLDKFNQAMADNYYADIKSKYGELTLEPKID